MNTYFEKLNEELEQYEPDPEDMLRTERKQLFMNIISEWESEDDVDYSIPLSTLTSLLEEAPGYMEDFKESIGCLNRISERTDSVPHWMKGQRIL